MSKIDKNIQEAREWQKKHGAEGQTGAGLDQALKAWETQMKLLEEALTKAMAARKNTIEARKAVGSALKTAKAARKVKPVKPEGAKPAAEKAPVAKKAPVKKVAAPKTKPEA